MESAIAWITTVGWIWLLSAIVIGGVWVIWFAGAWLYEFFTGKQV